MREIKFRAWDKTEKCWRYETIESICSAIYFGDTSALDLNHISVSDEMLENFCLFTGLKDKRGVEIYEGDLIRPPNVITGVIEVKIPNHYFLPWEPKETEIIGNVWENPELLGAEKEDGKRA